MLALRVSLSASSSKIAGICYYPITFYWRILSDKVSLLGSGSSEVCDLKSDSSADGVPYDAENLEP